MPKAEVVARTTAKIGITGALRRIPRKTAANGPTKSMASAGRQSCLGLDVIFPWKSPRKGESRNHAITNGKNAAAMRGRKDKPASPWVAKPMMVTIRMARISPRMRIDFFIQTCRGGWHPPLQFIFVHQILHFATQGTTTPHGWSVCRVTTWQGGPRPCRSLH
jgi:hypothetical protein